MATLCSAFFFGSSHTELVPTLLRIFHFSLLHSFISFLLHSYPSRSTACCMHAQIDTYTHACLAKWGTRASSRGSALWPGLDNAALAPCAAIDEATNLIFFTCRDASLARPSPWLMRMQPYKVMARYMLYILDPYALLRRRLFRILTCKDASLAT